MAKEYAKGFYLSKEWRATRDAYYKYKRGQCERCMKEFKEGKRTMQDIQAGFIVHHKSYITPKNINDPSVTLSFDNLELVCEDHHNKEHKARGRRYKFDKQGNIIPS